MQRSAPEIKSRKWSTRTLVIGGLLASVVLVFVFCVGAFVGSALLGARDNSAAAIAELVKQQQALAQAQRDNAQLLMKLEASHLRGSAVAVDPPAEEIAGGDGIAYEAASEPMVMPPPPQSFATFTGGTGLTTASTYEAEQITIAAWVRTPTLAVKDPQTIVSNRVSGCDASPLREGFGVAINTFGTTDGRIILYWGSPATGCHTLATLESSVIPGEWSNIGFSIEGGSSQPGTAKIFVNGVVTAIVDIGASSRSQQKQLALRIGQFADGAYPFHGDIASVLIFHAALSEAQLQQAASCTSDESLRQFSASPSSNLRALHFLNPNSFSLKVVNEEAIAKRAIAAAPAAVPVSEAPHAPVAALAPNTISLQNTPSPGGNRWISKLLKLPAQMCNGNVNSPAVLAAGTYCDDADAAALAQSDIDGAERAKAVKAALVHSWSGYKAVAWGADEVKPASGGKEEAWSGMGMTMIDALDTLWITGMTAEFNDARDWLIVNLNFGHVSNSVSFFETNIRVVGGLLAAYDLSKDKGLLDKAKDLVERLMPTFSSANGLPKSIVDLKTGESRNYQWTGMMSPLSELGSHQLEFRYLSRATGDVRYASAAENVIRTLQNRINPPNGLFPTMINPDSAQGSNSVKSFGAMGDSFYEYLLKTWLQGGKKEDFFLEMYVKAIDGMSTHLLRRSQPNGLAYLGPDGGQEMDELSCYVPAVLALGAYNAPGTRLEAKRWEHLILAKSLMYTCWQMFERSPTGLAPDVVTFNGPNDFSPKVSEYLLRPETAESLFVLHQLTGHPIYREWGWKLFSSIEKHCKLPFGYGSFPNVHNPSAKAKDKQESFFLAETLKYLYLLQAPDHSISLDTYVFNTEAHPLTIFK